MVETWHQDRQAINHVENIVLQLGWMWREQPILDYGIDGQIEICDDERKPTGQLFAVQSKGGESYFYRRQRDGGLTIRLQQKHLRYWNNYPLPVLVIGRLPSENRAYWLYIQEHLDRHPDVLKAETKNVSIKVPAKNVFDINAKPSLHVIPGRHLELIMSRISPNANVLDELLQMAEQAHLDPKAFRELVIEWHERAPDPIRTRVAKSRMMERMEQSLHRLQQDAVLLPETHLPMAKQVLQCLAQGLQGAGVKQIMDTPPRRLADRGTLLLCWKLGTQSPRLMLADYVGEIHSNRLSIILNPESSLTLRAYQKDGSLVEITSATYQSHEWLVAVAVWERPQVSLWINGQQFGPAPLPAGFNSLGPLLLFGLDIENKLSADTVRWAPPGEEIGLNFQKDGIWHGSCWQLATLWERAFQAQEIVRLCADPFAMLRPRLCNNGKCPDCGSPVVIDRDENNREPDKRLKRLDGSGPTREDFLPHPPAVWCVCTNCRRPCLSREGFPVVELGEGRRMISVTYSPQCQEVMRILEVTPEMVVTTINNRHRGVVDGGLTRIIAVHWFTDERIVFVDSTVSKRELERERNRVRFEEVTAQLVLELRPNLPSGSINRGMTMEVILAMVAKSFGYPVTCHPNHEPSTLYGGPWDGKRIDVKVEEPATTFICGSFSPDKSMCELVWAFNLDRYQKWLLG